METWDKESWVSELDRLRADAMREAIKAYCPHCGWCEGHAHLKCPLYPFSPFRKDGE